MRKLKEQSRDANSRGRRRYFYRGIRNHARFRLILVGAPTQREAHARAKHLRSSNSVESHGPSPHASGAPLPAPLGRSPPSPLSSFRPKTPRASFPPVHGGGRDKRGCHGLARLSPYSVQLQRLTQEPSGCVVLQNSLN